MPVFGNHPDEDMRSAGPGQGRSVVRQGRSVVRVAACRWAEPVGWPDSDTAEREPVAHRDRRKH